MNVKTIVALLVVFCLVSCAPVGSGLKIEGDTLSSDHPRLSVQFKKEIADIREFENDSGRAITFKEDYRPIVVQFHRIPHSTKIDYFKSLREIASNLNFYYIDGVKFGEKEWAKVAYYDDQCGCLYSGYMANKDNDFINIWLVARIAAEDEKDALIKYKKTMKMPVVGQAVIDKQFAYFDEVAEIR